MLTKLFISLVILNEKMAGLVVIFFCLNMLVIIGKQMKAPDYLEGRRGSLTVNKYRFFVNITV